MRSFADAGFQSVKMKFGALPLTQDLDRVRTARKTLGAQRELLVDANNAFTPHQAIRAGRALERFDIGWFEEPCWPDDLAGGAAVAQALDVPITAGELEYTVYGMRDLLDAGAADILNPDVMFCGGISEFLRIAQLAAARHVAVTPHAAHDVSVHLAAALPNCLAVEYFRPETDAMKDMLLYAATLEPARGELRVPNRPGLGIELDRRAVARYRVR
jgi:L-alanine-DL-glutamate epimerase-like enolase superfamily enzyme